MSIGFRVVNWHHVRKDIEDGQQDASGEFRKVVAASALRVKNDWRARWSPSRHLPYLGSSVTFDLKTTGEIYEAEIGPDKLRTQGPLGTIIENANGGARNRATHAGNRAGRAEAPRFEREAADAAAKAVGE